MNSFRPNFLLLMVALITLSCKTTETNSQTAKLPEWVHNPADEFSEAKYLMAVGSGSTMAEARSRAMQNLAQIFRSTVEGSQNLYSDVRESTRNNTEFTSQESIRLINNIRIGANEDLMNTEVLQSHVGGDGNYYVLAGMDRIESSRVYHQEMETNAVKIENHLVNSAQQSSVVRQLMELKQAVLLAKINENFSRQLEIILPGNTNAEANTRTLLKTQNQLKATQEKAVVAISLNHSHAVIEEAVAKAFQAQGFSVGDAASALLNVAVNYDAHEAKLNRDDAKFASWELSIAITEIANGQNYKTFTARGRDGALSLSDAYNRAEFSATKEIDTKFTRFLTTVLTAQN